MFVTMCCGVSGVVAVLGVALHVVSWCKTAIPQHAGPRVDWSHMLAPTLSIKV